MSEEQQLPPVPWVTASHSDPKVDVMYIRSAEGLEVATMYSASRYGRRKALQLLVSAPDLLAALKDLANCCGHCDGIALSEALQSAAAAIDKAEGRS
jgi:hypothetical protein